MILCVHGCALPGMAPRALCMPGKCSTTELQAQALYSHALKKSSAGDFFLNILNSLSKAITYLPPFISISYFLYALTKSLNVTSSEEAFVSLNYF